MNQQQQQHEPFNPPRPIYQDSHKVYEQQHEPDPCTKILIKYMKQQQQQHESGPPYQDSHKVYEPTTTKIIIIGEGGVIFAMFQFDNGILYKPIIIITVCLSEKNTY